MRKSTGVTDRVSGSCVCVCVPPYLLFRSLSCGLLFRTSNELHATTRRKPALPSVAFKIVQLLYPRSVASYRCRKVISLVPVQFTDACSVELYPCQSLSSSLVHPPESRLLARSTSIVTLLFSTQLPWHDQSGASIISVVHTGYCYLGCPAPPDHSRSTQPPGPHLSQP